MNRRKPAAVPSSQTRWSKTSDSWVMRRVDVPVDDPGAVEDPPDPEDRRLGVVDDR
jgi:hypothetical protein